MPPACSTTRVSSNYSVSRRWRKRFRSFSLLPRGFHLRMKRSSLGCVAEEQRGPSSETRFVVMLRGGGALSTTRGTTRDMPLAASHRPLRAFAARSDLLGLGRQVQQRVKDSQPQRISRGRRPRESAQGFEAAVEQEANARAGSHGKRRRVEGTARLGGATRAKHGCGSRCLGVRALSGRALR